MNCFLQRQVPSRIEVLAVSLLLCLPSAASAQLAITEVMSAPLANPLTGFRGPEYWELTNFGPTETNLHGFSFRDGVATRPLVKEPFTNLVLRAGESVVFFRVADSKESVTNAAQFRTWWGAGNLPADLQCRIWKSPGLSGWDGDAVVLFDENRKQVDAVQFGRARPGRAFTFDPETGFFGVLSAAGVEGAFTAVLADDVGSPGTAGAAVPVRLVQEPVSQSIDVGMSATFTAAGLGLPRPEYHWLFEGVVVQASPEPTLALAGAQPWQGGNYQLIAANGLSSATSAVVVLTVNTNDTSPSVAEGLADAVVFDQQTAVFSVAARGLPPPRFQWQSNGVDILNAVSPRLEIPDCASAWSGTRYSVRVWNPLGETNVSALLIVTRRPDLRFTEVMSLPSDEEGNRHFDWFELTNYDTNAVDLNGWRFADQASFNRAVTITNAFVLNPGESAIFAERLNESLFGDWWGRDNLPPTLKIWTYSGFGLGKFGEQLLLWNPAATDPNDAFLSMLWPAATLGISFEGERRCYAEDPENPVNLWCEDWAEVESAAGIRGAFRAATGIDIGSPGYVTNPPLHILALQHDAGGVAVKCRVTPGRRYRLCRALEMPSSSWHPVITNTALNNVLTFSDTTSTSSNARFYRIEEVP